MTITNMDRHIDFIGYLHIAQSALIILGGLLLFVVLAAGGMLSGDPTALFVTTTVGTVLGILLAIWAIPGFIAGYGILKRYYWGWVLGLIMGFFDLFNVPLGTALGLYTFWALLRDGARAEFDATAPSDSGV